MFHSRKFFYILFVVGALYALLVQQFFKNEARFIIQSKSYPANVSYSFSQEFQELNLPINETLNLHGLWFKKADSASVVLFFPDQETDLRKIKIEKNNYYESGFGIVIAAYRGSAKSTEKATDEADLYSDAQHWYNFVRSQYSENKIIVVGEGFGASIAAYIAGENNPKALILETPAFSYSDYLAKSRFWWIPFNTFTSFHLNTWENIRKASCEIVLIIDTKKSKNALELGRYLKPTDLLFELSPSNEWSSATKQKFEIYLNSIH
ncbi:MAG TPA: hypothetical protein DCG69_09815 [Bacteroidales bacterium]|nr:hypothetical protein [Bacteroidales bacterium]